ncbi:MAG: hypothetical protein V7704_08120 [Aurantimonas endophytica]|uniref:hypothetical protein n=1 Tax=Aurantimonas endophytica TaxID=1522175 RepID=UPI0030023102
MLDLTLKVMELQTQIRRMDDDAERRHRALMDALVPDDDEVEAPTDIAGPLSDWMKR